MIGQVTNTTNGFNHYIKPVVEIVDLMTEESFLTGSGEDWNEGPED